MGKNETGGNINQIRILLTFFMSKKSIRAGYLTSGARKAFNYLRHIFI